MSLHDYCHMQTFFSCIFISHKRVDGEPSSTSHGTSFALTIEYVPNIPIKAATTTTVTLTHGLNVFWSMRDNTSSSAAEGDFCGQLLEYLWNCWCWQQIRHFLGRPVTSISLVKIEEVARAGRFFQAKERKIVCLGRVAVVVVVLWLAPFVMLFP